MQLTANRVPHRVPQDDRCYHAARTTTDQSCIFKMHSQIIIARCKNNGKFCKIISITNNVLFDVLVYFIYYKTRDGFARTCFKIFEIISTSAYPDRNANQTVALYVLYKRNVL